MSRELTFNDLSLADATEVAFVMDEESFRIFYERNARSLWAFLLRVTGDRHTADDLLQEAFYRFLRARAVYEDENHRRNSLYRIAANLAKDVHRRDGRSTAMGDAAETLPAPDATSAADFSTDVSRAMSRLKPREREMLWLAYAEGASHVEIASALGLRPGSIKMLLFRAKRNLAALLRGSSGETR